MPKLIKNGEVVEDNWILVAKDAKLPGEDIATNIPVILPLSLWQQHADQLAKLETVGLWLDCDEEPAKLATEDSSFIDHIRQLPLIALNFPVFSDGRGYSYARQLRDQFDYQGELRAIGDVLKDQLFFYQRCGFNSFATRDDRDENQALLSLQDFSICYQATNDSSLPAFRKR